MDRQGVAQAQLPDGQFALMDHGYAASRIGSPRLPVEFDPSPTPLRKGFLSEHPELKVFP